MIDKQGRRFVVECDSCDETLSSEENETFPEFWSNVKSVGGRAKKIGAEWLHGCPQCGV